MIAAGIIGTVASRMRSHGLARACRLGRRMLNRDQKPIRPDSTMASIPSTVCAGSSRAVSRVPGPPPRTSTLAATALIEQDCRDAGAELGISGMPDTDPCDIGNQIAQHGVSLKDFITSDHVPAKRLHDACNRSRSVASKGPMNSDVTFLAALAAGLVSFLSPCVLPLVPPYLIFLTGTSLERFADKEPKPRVKRETVVAAALFVLGFSTVFVALGASASVDRLTDPRVFGAARDHCRCRHHHHGSALPRDYAHSAAAPAETAGSRQARRPLGRLCDRAGLRLRMDAVHRADPCRHSGGGGVRADRGARVRACLRSIRSASAFLSLSRPWRSSRSRHSCRVSAIICTGSSRRWARYWS